MPHVLIVDDDAATREATFKDPIHGVNGPNARYIELWNNVFMQSERLQSGELKPLRNQNVDTGMGFERVVSVIQGSGSNYETDVFQPIIGNLGEIKVKANDKGWRRVIVEKPFGQDLESARSLNALLGRYFSEAEVFRIDHYLGKETVQNILVLRFGKT